MKSTTTLLLVALLSAACQKESIPASPDVPSTNPLTNSFIASQPKSDLVKSFATLNLTQIADSKETTKFNVSLRTPEGQPVDKDAPVQPNSLYQVVVQGTEPTQYVLKMGEGFEVVKAPDSKESLTAVYVIKTLTEVAPQLYLTIVPVKQEEGILKKERPTGFLLPN